MSPTFPKPTPTPLASSFPNLKRSTFVTVSVIANDTSTSAPSSDSSSGFPVAIAIPALVGGMALAIGVFSFWWWWTKRSKRVKRERWEAAQRRKNKRRLAAEKASPRPSTSTSRKNPGGPKSPASEKSSKDKSTALSPPPSAAQRNFPNGAQAAYGAYAAQQAYGNGNEGWQTQPGIEQQQQYGYSYDQYGQPMPLSPVGQQSISQQQQYEGSYAPVQQTAPISKSVSSDTTAPLASQGAPVATSPTSPTSSKKESSVPSPKRSKSEEKQSSSQSRKGSRAVARMAVADNAAAAASVDPMYRHKPSKPSPLAIKAQQEREAAVAQRVLDDQNPFYAEPDELTPVDSRANAAWGEWGVALGTPTEGTPFSDSQAAVLEDNVYGNGNQTQSGLYTQDPYALYHDDDEDEQENRFHDAAASYGLGGGNKEKKRDMGRRI
ncbi:hypothetical protein L198_03408 [Cryptococcus wingfieldii CBS 7118]|uniref:Uncharacterized protein n=1 Tax=Cryptococcus wingfieldii CBS 7118 TaxID=1295528 RepID=A0A1E3JFF3_9TREE|nr:hypothetical protein L198_03408 [Cryptococcus wingfieldii CBS 7118]ODN99564.1 hypothetical protein L198_03408 [Cryptococcus wingfieldii CBS 7118]